MPCTKKIFLSSLLHLIALSFGILFMQSLPVFSTDCVLTGVSNMVVCGHMDMSVCLNAPLKVSASKNRATLINLYP